MNGELLTPSQLAVETYQLVNKDIMETSTMYMENIKPQIQNKLFFKKRIELRSSLKQSVYHMQTLVFCGLLVKLQLCVVKTVSIHSCQTLLEDVSGGVLLCVAIIWQGRELKYPFLLTRELHIVRNWQTRRKTSS